MEVWDTGVVLPVIMIEVMLTAHIVKAWSLNCPLGVTQTIKLVKILISGTKYKETMIKWKTSAGGNPPAQSQEGKGKGNC